MVPSGQNFLNEKTHMKKKKKKTTLDDVIKAMRRGSREAEKDLRGPGFHSTHSVHVSKKTYTRKTKHKQDW